MTTSIPRRSFLATLAALGVASALGPAAPAAAAPARGRRARSCILLWMNGGPSHIDTWDPKRGETAGPFRSIATAVSGLRVSEHLPRLAERAGRLAVLRGMTSKEGSHERAQQLVHSGRTPNPTVDAPSLGAWVARERADAAAALPPYVALGGPAPGAGFLGRSYDPLVVQDPGDPPANLHAPRSIDRARDDRRQALVSALDGELAARIGQPVITGRAAVRERAVRLGRSSDAGLFDLSGEPAETLERYGDSGFGRGCLVARRLVERAVPFALVVLDGWDTHRDGFARTERLCAQLDPAMSALLDDLRDRELADDVIVVCMGEFGRTPRISGEDGRDHHPGAWSAVLSGGGVRGGVVHGETDARGAAVVADPTSVADLHATIAASLGLDPGLTRLTPEGRPISLTDGGRPIAALLG